MTHDIISWRTLAIRDLTISFDDIQAVAEQHSLELEVVTAGRINGRDVGRPEKSCVLRFGGTGETDNPSLGGITGLLRESPEFEETWDFIVTSIGVSGEGSGRIVEGILVPLLKKSWGELEANLVRDDGESVFTFDVVVCDGEISQGSSQLVRV